MNEFPDEPLEDEVGEPYPMTDVTHRQQGISKVEEKDSSQDDAKDDNTKKLEELTKEVKKLKKKNKSLKKYIGSIAEAFAKKLKVKLPDCITSSSSSDEERESEPQTTQEESPQILAAGTSQTDHDDETDREIETPASEEGTVILEHSPDADDAGTGTPVLDMETDTEPLTGEEDD